MMALCGESCTTRYVPYKPAHPRATPSPCSDDRLKDKGLERLSHRGNHQLLQHHPSGSDQSLPVAPSPGSNKTSVNPNTQSLNKRDVQPVLDRVKQFLEAKPAEPLVIITLSLLHWNYLLTTHNSVSTSTQQFDNVDWVTFRKLDLDNIRWLK